MKLCSICKREVNAESAPILTMGGFGNPKYLCDDCAEQMDAVTCAREPENIEQAMKCLSARISDSQTDDEVVIGTVAQIFSEAGERAKLIREGKYDFSAETEQVEDDIPEELLETEEDKALDEKEAREQKKIDSILNWVTAFLFAGAAIFMIIYFLF